MPPLHPDMISLDRIRSHTNGLADLAGQLPFDQPVTTCGDWTLADLLWHLLEVQHFWCHIISERPAGPEDYIRLDRPDDEALADSLRSAGTHLVGLLAESDPADEAWSWATEQTVGFTVRRQTHEALVHHIDGLLAGGLELPDIPPRLGADGVDEMFGVMLTVPPSTPGLELDGTVIELTTTDTDDGWTLGFGRLDAMADDGTTNTATTLSPVEGATPTASVTGPAAAMNLWLWNRVDRSAMSVDGDPEVVDRLFALIATVSG